MDNADHEYSVLNMHRRQVRSEDCQDRSNCSMFEIAHPIIHVRYACLASLLHSPPCFTLKLCRKVQQKAQTA